MLLQSVSPFTHANSPVTFHKADPDIIDGHNFVGVFLRHSPPPDEIASVASNVHETHSPQTLLPSPSFTILLLSSPHGLGVIRNARAVQKET
jgi:hypothetical protein